MNSRIFIDSFDHDSDEPNGLRGEKLDRYILSHSKKVSCFWIEESPARAKRITEWRETGVLKLDNKKYGYPWNAVIYFDRNQTVKKLLDSLDPHEETI
jgi:hypothetical protein